MIINRIERKDLDWWLAKIARRGNDCFNPSVGTWAAHALKEFVLRERVSLEAGSLEELSQTLSVPQKYLTRSIATLTRCGLVHANLHPIHVLVLQLDVFPKRKGAAQTDRTALSKKAKMNIFASDGYICAHCLQQFSYSELHLDHIVPVSLLGADEPGNLVSMCGQCNGKKSEKFIRNYMNQYRLVAVNDPIQLRFLSGRFWPVVNGSVRNQMRREIVSAHPETTAPASLPAVK